MSDSFRTVFIETDYVRADGATAPLPGVTPVAGADLATKDYVDAVASGVVSYLPAVLDRLDTPPGAPVLGDRYLVDAPAAGAWTGLEDHIQEWDGAAWIDTAPAAGMQVYCIASGCPALYNGSAWVRVGGLVSHSALQDLAADDHTQYLRADGTRALTAVIVGVDPTDPTHLATAAYVDTAETAAEAYADAADLVIAAAADAYADGVGVAAAAYTDLEVAERVPIGYGGIDEVSSAGTTITLTTSGTFYPWISSAAVQREGMSYGHDPINGDYLSPDATGVWAADFQLAFGGSANTTYTVAVFVNGVLTRCSTMRRLGTGGDVGSCSAKEPLALTAGLRVTLRISAGANAKAVQIFRAQLNLARLS